jgi:hypothetical protein
MRADRLAGGPTDGAEHRLGFQVRHTQDRH